MMMNGEGRGGYGRGTLGGFPAGNSWGKSGSGSRTGLWSSICKGTCGVQILGGLIMVILSSKYLFDYMATMGVVIGALMVGVGVIGMLGAFNNNKDLLNFHIVGAILAILLSFQFVGSVWREVEVDCALAELFIKGSLMEEITTNLANHEMFNTVYQRINEVEDMLGMVHNGVIKTFHMFDYDPDHPDVLKEREFINKKLESLKLHASTALQEVTTNPNITQDAVNSWTEEDRKKLEDKLMTASQAIQRIEEHQKKAESDKGITAEEYEQLLYSVTQAFLTPIQHSKPGELDQKDTLELAKLHEDLDQTKGYLSKMEASVSSLEEINKANVELNEEIKKRRNQFNTVYMEELKKAKEKHGSFHADSLASMPEHCVKEEAGIGYMGFAGVLVACAQLVSVYFTLCLLFRLPVKME